MFKHLGHLQGTSMRVLPKTNNLQWQSDYSNSPNKRVVSNKRVGLIILPDEIIV